MVLAGDAWSSTCGSSGHLCCSLTALSAQEAKKLPLQICETCQFFDAGSSSDPKAKSKCRLFPKAENKSPEEWCGQWKPNENPKK